MGTRAILNMINPEFPPLNLGILLITIWSWRDINLLYFEEQSFTYGEVARNSNRVGNTLRELGVHIEDRILIALPDCPEFVWSWFGAARVGAVITMVNPLLPAADYPYYLEYTRARVAVIHESLAPAFKEAARAAPHLRAISCRRLAPSRRFAKERRGARMAVFTDPEPAFRRKAPRRKLRDDSRLVIHSGSTGHTKGAVHLSMICR